MQNKAKSLNLLLTSSFVAVLSWSHAVIAATPTLTSDLAVGKCDVSFLAVGNPGYLKIKGQAKPASDSQQPLSGKLVLDSKTLKGTAAFKLEMLDTGIGLRNKHMKDEYLEVGKYPLATLTLKPIEIPASTGDDVDAKDLPFTGDLELHGQIHPVSGVASIQRKTTQVELKAEFKLKLSDFGIRIPKFMNITVAEDVTASVTYQGALEPGVL